MICVLMVFCAAIIQSQTPPNYGGQVAQFDAPAIVLTAHNYLDGQFFEEIKVGNMIRYNESEWVDYKVVDVLRFEALQPNSIYTQLFDGITIYSPRQIHEQIFNKTDTLVLQTCIYKNNLLSWGRLFIVAELQ